MPTPKTYNLGPGTLNLGAGATAFAIQVRACRITCTENVTTSDDIPVLSGDKLAGTSSATYSWAISGTFLQDIKSGGIVQWSWANKGTPQTFSFTPSTAAGSSATGTCRPVPLDFGGDVQNPADQPANPPTSDFNWRIDGDPVGTFAA